MKRIAVLSLLLSASTASLAGAADADHARNMAQGLTLFKDQVRQVLVDHCLRCHGGEKTKAEFNLATREDLLKGGATGPAVLLGNSAGSYFMHTIRHEEDPFMPQKEPKLPDATIAAIAKWIDLGAPYDKPLVEKADSSAAHLPMQVTAKDKEFWSFRRLAQVKPPELATPATRGPGPRSGPASAQATPIDRFLGVKLQEKGLAMNPPASRRQLLRRAYLDVLGIPPTFEQVQAFEQDASPDAWAKVVDQLLANPQMGERWARHWLDVARFGESEGGEHDYNRPNAYHYRDFVIRALNSDMPYDRFVRWQIAGDELEPTNRDAVAATGFLAAGSFPTQLTEREFEAARYDDMDDMLSTTGSAMLGLSLGCARCHDHKYDPIPAADYYRLLSTFTTTIRTHVQLPADDQAPDALAPWQAQRNAILTEIKQDETVAQPARFAAWLKENASGLAQSPLTAWQGFDSLQYKSKGGATFTAMPDGSHLLTGKSPDNDTWTITAATKARGVTGLRLEALTDASLVRGGPGRAANGNFALSQFKVSVKPAQGSDPPAVVKLRAARADFEQNTTSLSAAASIDNNPVSGWAVDPQFGKDHALVVEFDQPVSLEGGAVFTLTLHFNNNVKHSIGRPRLSLSTVDAASLQPVPGPAAAALLAMGPAGDPSKLEPKAREVLLNLFRATDATWQQLQAKLREHDQQKPQQKMVTILAATEGIKPLPHHADGRGFPHFYKETYELGRGDVNQKKGVVQQGFMQVLTADGAAEKDWQVAPPAGWRTSYRRVSLANWMTDVERGAGSLLARVIVNRLWQHHFGRGIVATPSDFGFQGDRPSHPELLDYLAQDLIAHGWSLKHLHRQIMLSQAYQQSSEYDSRKAEADPLNQLLWRFTPRRLEGEAVRDAMLAASGLLDPAMYGPGTLDENHRRRSIYYTVKRSQMVSMMQAFDMPEPLVSVGSRPSTTVAPQALLLLNSGPVQGWAANLARLASTGTNEPAAVVRGVYQRTLGRLPTPAEAQAAEAFLSKQSQSYREARTPDRSLQDFCLAVLSLNEFVYID